MKQEYLVSACGGAAIPVIKGQSITLIDLEGSQVVDFFAEVLNKPSEFLSAGVTNQCWLCAIR